MAVSTSGYCKITGLSKAMPKSRYIPMMPALSQNEQSQLFGCKITMAAHMDHHYVPIIEYGKGKGPGVISCKITGRVAHTIVKEVPMPEPTIGEIKRVHHYRQDYRYMEPFISRLTNEGERKAMQDLMERMAQRTQLDPCHYFIYALNDRRTGKTGLVLPFEYEEAIRCGAIEQILLSGDSNSLVCRLKEGVTCTIPMDKVTKNQIERLSQDALLYDGHGPDREIIEAQRREKAAKEKEDREQMAQYLAEMEKKRKDREAMKKQKMKETMIKKMAEAEEAERRQKERDAEIKRQYEEAAQIRADAEAAKLAARNQRLAERERKELEEKARRAEEMAKLAEEEALRKEAERKALEENAMSEEAAAAAALADINPYDLSVNELIDHMKDKVGDEADIVKALEDAGKEGFSSTELAGMVTASTQEAIDEVYGEDMEDEAIGETEIDEEELARRKKEREERRLARKQKREEMLLKDEEKRKLKAERERKRQEMQDRLAALRRADAEDEAANLRMPEMRNMPEIEIRRRKRPADLDLTQGADDEYVVRTPGGREVRSGADIDDESMVEGRLSPNSSRMEPGRLMRTKDGREFIAGKIISWDDGEEEFVPGKAVDLPDGPKFVPGQTIATKDGPQFVAGKTFVERENVRFVPGHVVDLGGDVGEIFVPGQVMDTIDGPKFIPGSVYESKKGPLFVPGQIREGIFIPGEIIETEDGPRFITPEFAKEKVFTFMVQSFDLHPIEIDIVRYQYHSPQPSPVFEGQDLHDTINLMQMAAKGYQAKMLPLPESLPVPPKTKQQIYENVKMTLLECLERTHQAKESDKCVTSIEECTNHQAKRLQRVLLDDLDCPVKTSRAISFLNRFTSHKYSPDELIAWLDGFFWQTKLGIFRTLEPLPERPNKFGSHVSLRNILSQMIETAPVLLASARIRDEAFKDLAQLINKPLPERTYESDLSLQCRLLLSRLLLTASKEILYHTYMALCRNNLAVTFSILDDMKDKIPLVSCDSEAVALLETAICQRVINESKPWLEQVIEQLCADEQAGEARDIADQSIGLAILERNSDIAEILSHSLSHPVMANLIKLSTMCQRFLHVVIVLHVLAGKNEVQQNQLHTLSKNHQRLNGNIQWLNLLCGAKLITEFACLKAKTLSTSADIPRPAISHLSEHDSVTTDRIFHRVLLEATQNIHHADLSYEPGPALVIVTDKFERIIPQALKEDVINGRADHLLVNSQNVLLRRKGEIC